jgi:hypothetical protein
MTFLSGPTRPRVFVAVVCCTAAALALAGCDLATSSLRATATDEWLRTYSLEAPGRLEIVNTNGFIEVEQTAGAAVEVRAERIGKGATDEIAREALQRIEIREDVSPNGVRLETRLPGGGGILSGGGAEVRYRVKVPAGTDVSLRTTNGRIVANGLDGRVVARSTNGGITGRGLAGPVEARTTNGAIEIEVESVVEDGVELGTTNGAIRLRLPESARGDLRARVQNGSIAVSGLDVEQVGETSRRRFEGRLGGGGPRIELSTTNGGIRVEGRGAGR